VTSRDTPAGSVSPSDANAAQSCWRGFDHVAVLQLTDLDRGTCLDAQDWTPLKLANVERCEVRAGDSKEKLLLKITTARRGSDDDWFAVWNNFSANIHKLDISSHGQQRDSTATFWYVLFLASRPRD